MKVMFPEVTCQPRELRNGGSQREQNEWKAGDVINFTCNHGYKLEGRRSDVCTDSGNWAHRDLPDCNRVY